MSMLNLYKKIFFIISFAALFSINYSLMSGEEIKKEYFNNIFGGGKEKIIILKGDINNINIDYANININLFDNYSNIKAVYSIKNNGNDIEILFAYPKIDAKIIKIIEEKGNRKNTESKIIDGSFLNYSILINEKPATYIIKEEKEKEINLPYKIGDYFYNKSINKNNETIVNEEMIDSYYYTYSWYITQINIKKDETKRISISYNTPHYYNIINVENISRKLDLEDPALSYLSKIEGKSKTYNSEKIFIYNFNTSYSDRERIIDKIYIKLKSNIIDQDFLKILPINYKKRGNSYYWKYKNLKSTPINNILVKISPVYSKETINPFLFTYKPEKKIDGVKSYFEINKSKNEIILEYNDYNNESIKINKIRIFPDYYESKFDLKEMNKPLLIEVEFSNYPDFSNSTKVIEKIRNKEFIRLIQRRSHVDIYKGDEIPCKFIKIKVLNTSNENDIVKISDIQVLK